MCGWPRPADRPSRPSRKNSHVDARSRRAYDLIVTSARSNRLANEPSLYLRQHAHNPVDWYPWGPEALARSRAEDRPILLSIGYSACHWCHVMERESFENEEIARVMNDNFVCIKVDREERPDLDSIYMKSVQMMTGHGGWPMTLFLTPDLRPFYAGTYFPPEERGGMPGFSRVLTAVAQAYHDQSAKVAESGARIVELLERDAGHRGDAVILDDQQSDGLAAALAEAMDAEHGGFGRAPKFPGTLSLGFLIDREGVRADARRNALVRTALDKMANGGIYDHLAGGFHRYSVDRYWLVPHFEKMLYDQALLADVYGAAWLLYRDLRYKETAVGVLEFVAREMAAEGGGFYSAQDADSEGEEGRYYVWTPDEVRAVVGDDAAEVVCRFFDVSEEGNFEGGSILHRTITFGDAGKMFDRRPEEIRRIVDAAAEALYTERKRRVAPATDRKILADWNGLMIGAMALAARRVGRLDLIESAAGAADFVRERMWDGEGLKHFLAEGEARVAGFLDDYAFFGRGCLEVFLALGRPEDFESARRAADVLIEDFEDRERGGFYFTRRDGERLLVRTRDLFDGAVPAGNSVAAELLLRLYQLTGNDEYRRAGEATVAAFLAAACANPYAGSHLLTVAERHRRGYVVVVVAGDVADPATRSLERAAIETLCPEASVYVTAGALDDRLPVAVRGKIGAGRDRTVAYVCRHQTCAPPVSDPRELADVLRASAAPS